MPPRYQQDRLVSPVVGTPGADPTAGAVEAKIAEASNQAIDTQNQAAMQQLKGAQSDFNQSQIQFYYAGKERQAAQLRKQNEQDAIEAALKTDTRLTDLNQKIESLQSTYSDNPAASRKAYQQLKSDGIAGIQTDPAFEGNDRVKRMVLTHMINAYQSGEKAIDKWATKKQDYNNYTQGLREVDALQFAAGQAQSLQEVQAFAQKAQKITGALAATTDPEDMTRLTQLEALHKSAPVVAFSNYFNSKIILDPDKGDVTQVNTKQLQQELSVAVKQQFISPDDAVAIQNKLTLMINVQHQMQEFQQKVESNQYKIEVSDVMAPFVQADPIKDLPHMMPQLRATKDDLATMRKQEEARPGGPRIEVLASIDSGISQANTFINRAEGVGEKLQREAIAAQKDQTAAINAQTAALNKQHAQTLKLTRENPESIQQVQDVLERAHVLSAPTPQEKRVVGGKTRGLKQSAKTFRAEQLPKVAAELDKLYAGGEGKMTKEQYAAAYRDLKKAQTLMDKNLPPEIVEHAVRQREYVGRDMRLIDTEAGDNPVYRSKMKNAYFDRLNAWRARIPNMTPEQEDRAAQDAYNYATSIK